MKIDENNVFFFSNDNIHHLHRYDMQGLIDDDFSIYCRFKPDHDTIDEKLEKDGLYNGGVFAKNGMHFGIFFNVGYSADKVFRMLTFTFWEHNKKLNKDEPKYIIIHYDKEDRYYDVCLRHDKKNKKFTLTEGNEKREIGYDNLVDYSNSYTWIGAATLIAKEHQSVFYGDIDKIHIQKSITDNYDFNEFMTDYDSFISRVSKDVDIKCVFSTDFSKITYYKIFDMTGNGIHPVKFKKDWLIL